MTASVNGASASVLVHVVEATRPPPGTPPEALKDHQFDGYILPQTDIPGQVFFAIGPGGVAAPEYDVDAHLTEAGAWVFRVTSIVHRYKIGVQPSISWGTRVDVGGEPPNAPVFPAPPGWSYAQVYQQAHDDLNAAAHSRVPYGPIVLAPPMTHYWARWVTLLHEWYHVDDFYLFTSNWNNRMSLFEQDVAHPGVTVTFTCDNPATMTADGAINGMRTGAGGGQAWNALIAGYHHDAIDQWQMGGAEFDAHSVSNPKYMEILATLPPP